MIIPEHTVMEKDVEIRELKHLLELKDKKIKELYKIINDVEEENPFARNEAYIEHRKEFPYYPDKHKERCPHN